MVCTCGRISRPLGASLSIGTTSTASSPGPTRSPTMAVGRQEFVGRPALTSASRSRRCRRPWTATVLTTGRRTASIAASGFGRGQVDLVEHDDRGHAAASGIRRASPSSNSPQSPASATITPRSVRSKTCARLLDAQFAERAHVVDAGGVDEQHRAERQQLHGLLDRVGGGAGDCRETMETCWRVMALSRLDLPTLRRPKMPMWSRMPLGEPAWLLHLRWPHTKTSRSPVLHLATSGRRDAALRRLHLRPGVDRSDCSPTARVSGQA